MSTEAQIIVALTALCCLVIGYAFGRAHDHRLSSDAFWRGFREGKASAPTWRVGPCD